VEIAGVDARKRRRRAGPARVAMPVAEQMVVQVAARDIGQLTYTEHLPADAAQTGWTSQAMTVDLWPKLVDPSPRVLLNLVSGRGPP
jgi:hypothetical protein